MPTRNAAVDNKSETALVDEKRISGRNLTSNSIMKSRLPLIIDTHQSIDDTTNVPESQYDNQCTDATSTHCQEGPGTHSSKKQGEEALLSNTWNLVSGRWRRRPNCPI